MLVPQAVAEAAKAAKEEAAMRLKVIAANENDNYNGAAVESINATATAAEQQQ